MTALTTRNALAKALAEHRLHASMNYCLACRWRPTAGAGSLAEQHEAHRIDVLLASGAVIDAATLPDDEALVERLREIGFAGAHPMQFAAARRDVRTILRALAAALTERGEGR